MLPVLPYSHPSVIYFWSGWCNKNYWTDLLFFFILIFLIMSVMTDYWTQNTWRTSVAPNFAAVGHQPLYSPAKRTLTVGDHWREMTTTLLHVHSLYMTNSWVLIIVLFVVSIPWIPDSRISDYSLWSITQSGHPRTFLILTFVHINYLVTMIGHCEWLMHVTYNLVLCQNIVIIVMMMSEWAEYLVSELKIILWRYLWLLF